MSPPQQLRQQTSNCSSLLIYRPRKDERGSLPSWLTYSGWLTHISGHPSATSRAQDSESTSAKDQCSAAGPRNHFLHSDWQRMSHSTQKPSAWFEWIPWRHDCAHYLIHLLWAVLQRRPGITAALTDTNTAAYLYIGLFAVSTVGFNKLHLNWKT